MNSGNLKTKQSVKSKEEQFSNERIKV